METLVLVLMLLVCFNFALKQTFMKFWQAAVVVVILAIMVGLLWPLAIEQSKSQISLWLANQALMLDTSVVITLETVWQLTYCMLSAHLMHTNLISGKMLWLYRVLRFFPGIMIVPVLFSALVALEYEFTGGHFATVGWSFAAVVAVGFPLVSMGIKWLLPEKTLRLEVLFLTNVLVLTLGVIATVNGTTNFHGSDEVNWLALLAFVGLLLVCGTVGLGYQQYKKYISHD